jgi:hypothetical protein
MAINTLIPESELSTLESIPCLAEALTEKDLTIIEKDMREEFPQNWGFNDDLGEGLDRPINLDETNYMIPGTLALIDKIESAIKEGNPYDTIFFLDKSARPAYYLFNVLQRELDNRGLLSREHLENKPQIKFLDIGKTNDPWKYSSETINEMLYKKLPIETVAPRGKASRVMIVDEFKDTGVTLNSAIMELEDLYGIEAEGYYQFKPKFGPFWYRNPSYNLLEDAKISEQVKKLFSDPITEERIAQIEIFQDLANSLDRQDFVTIVESRLLDQEKGITHSNTGQLIEKLQKEGQDICKTELLEQLDKLANMRVTVSPESLYDLFATSGGKFSKARRGDRTEAFLLREMMEKLAVKVADEIEKKVTGLQ